MSLNSLGCIAGILLFFGIFLILKSFNVSSSSAANNTRNKGNISSESTLHARSEAADEGISPSYHESEDRERRNDNIDWWEPRERDEDDEPRQGIMDRFWDEVVGIHHYKDDEDD